MHKQDNPKKVAKIVSEKYNQKGYVLDFSIESLENEIDNILEKEIPQNWIESAKLESELTAYIGETICQLLNANWKGEYYLKNSAMNFYTCKIEKNGFEFRPSHFISYYLSNGKQNEGSFKEYLYSRDYSKGIFKDFSITKFYR
ncbi:hypothetical protein [uncultured Tenacibaculum sp.]|uniref:hypothetical protein n=1 Tax=uncultured Tenacibaculum sp. TaxID=174713 RepID=UPI00261A02AD|nr:hypothetical protein [uncultured Tenacibaculum sp.]